MALLQSDLKKIFPHALPDYLAALERNERLLIEAGVLPDPVALCHFLAQSGVETGGFTILAENGNYSADRLRVIFRTHFSAAQAAVYAHKPQAILSRAYANRMGNGSEASGEGWKFRGRSFFQTTGKENYQRIGASVRLDLIADPDLLITDFSAGLKAALKEWSALDLTSIVCKLGPTHEAVLAAARGINCGNVRSTVVPNGFAERKLMFDKVWKAFGSKSTEVKLDPIADGILEEGESGEPVKALQLELARLGYTVGEANGVYGPRTTAAVAAFQAREKLKGAPGKWQIKWNDKLAGAEPIVDAARTNITASDLVGKPGNPVGLLMWLRGGLWTVAAFFGLDTASDQAGVQLPQTFVDMRKAVEPIASGLQWLQGSRSAVLVLLCIGGAVLVSAGIRQLVDLSRKFKVI